MRTVLAQWSHRLAVADRIARGLVLTDYDEGFATRVADDTVTADDFVRVLANPGIGIWWGVLGEYGDLVDFEVHAEGSGDPDDTLRGLIEEGRTGEDFIPGEIKVVLIAKRPTRGGEPWDPEVHNPQDALMGNSYLEPGERIDLVEIRYDAGWGWRSLPTSRTVTAHRVVHSLGTTTWYKGGGWDNPDVLYATTDRAEAATYGPAVEVDVDFAHPLVLDHRSGVSWRDRIEAEIGAPTGAWPMVFETYDGVIYQWADRVWAIGPPSGIRAKASRSALTHDEVLDLYVEVVPASLSRQVAVALVGILGLTPPADPFAALVGRGRVEAERVLAAGIAEVNGGKVCDRCGGTGTYGHYGVCYDCGGRRWV